MESDPTRALVWMIGLPDITLLGVGDGPGGVGKIHVETVARACKPTPFLLPCTMMVRDLSRSR